MSDTNKKIEYINIPLFKSQISDLKTAKNDPEKKYAFITCDLSNGTKVSFPANPSFISGAEFSKEPGKTYNNVKRTDSKLNAPFFEDGKDYKLGVYTFVYNPDSDYKFNITTEVRNKDVEIIRENPNDEKSKIINADEAYTRTQNEWTQEQFAKFAKDFASLNAKTIKAYKEKNSLGDSRSIDEIKESTLSNVIENNKTSKTR